MDVVINSVGTSKSHDAEHARIIDRVTNKLLIEAAVKHKVEKFIFVTSMAITQENALISFILNTIVPNTFGHKLASEN